MKLILNFLRERINRFIFPFCFINCKICPDDLITIRSVFLVKIICNHILLKSSLIRLSEKQGCVVFHDDLLGALKQGIQPIVPAAASTMFNSPNLFIPENMNTLCLVLCFVGQI